MSTTIKFIDLFAGIGGMRLGLEQACKTLGIQSECVFTSEIKPTAVKVYHENFSGNNLWGDITEIYSHQIPDFDILLAGFPCQPFSSAGTKQGFLDTRGTLFFEIERILKDKSPFGFLL
ncbi:DNA (cytosine-5-)-methyltransferase [Anabaena minutissima FACHB-250]|nr:DNA (cytosine-5-)-methyltransferase [Anabaena minutissima FACHB-250]